MSSSHRGSRAPIGRIQLVLRLSLVLAITLLSIPFLGAVARADEGVAPVDPAATAAADPATDAPGTEDPGTADPVTTDPVTTDPATTDQVTTDPASTAPAAEAPVAEAPTPAPAKNTRTASSSTLTQATDATATGTCPPYTGGGKVLGFDQNTAEDKSGAWINGALNQNNSSYAEGDFVPQRLQLGSLNPGLHTFSFTYERTKSQGSDFAYAYDYVDGLNITGATSFSWDAATPAQPMPFATAVTVNVTFTMPTGTSGAATVTWRGHIASELVYGPHMSASWISGAPYHFGLGTLDCASMGSQDNQLMASAIEYATLTVVKDAQPNGPTDFDFAVDAPNGLSRTLTLDDDSDPTLSDRATYQVPPGTTTIREAAAGDWTLTGITCTDTSATTSVGTRTAAVDLSDRESVTCTFTNTRTASVSVDKRWVVKTSDADPGTTYTEATKPAHLGLHAQLKLSGPGSAGATNQAWGVPRDGYTQGANASIDETSSIGNPLCAPVSSKVTAANGSQVTGGSLPYAAALGGGANTYTLTNTVLCTGQLTLVKVVDNGPAVATAWTLSATRSDAGALQGPSGTSGSSAATGPVSAGATYELGETGGDSRYAQAGAWQCTDGVGVSNGRIQVAAGRSTTCTVHNATAKVTLVKSVTNDNGGTATAAQWTLHAGGFSGTSGQSFWVKPGDTLALSESGGPSGYGTGPSSLTCSDAPGQVTSVTPTAGASVTCTFVNDDEPASLALTKILAQGDSGSQTPASDFTLTATPQSITGQATESGAGGYPARSVKAGTYLLTESGPTGYTPGTWNCTGGTMGGSTGAQTVTVANGGAASCSITNTAIMPTLTLVKDKEAGTTGSTTPATAWTLTANGPTMIAGSTGSTGASGVTGHPVPIGTYALSESGPTDGWTASDWVCTGGATMGGTKAARTVTIDLGENVICTITNTAKPAHLSLDKDVRSNGTGTTLGDTAWTLAYDGPATADGAGGVTRTEVPIGNYTLTESGPTAGWTAAAWTCTRAVPGGTSTAHQVTTDADGTGHVNIALGEDVSCQVVNTAQPSYLALDKDARANGTGTTLGDNDWTLAYDGPATSSGAGGVARTEVPIGNYTLTESGPTSGWTAGDWTCGGHPVSTDAAGVGHLTIGLGENVSCSIVNTATAPKLTLVKQVERGSTGTTTPATAWTLTATGPTMVSASTGSTGPTGVTGRTVQVGTYALAETGPTDGWTASDWVCTGGATTGGTKAARTVTIDLGQNVTCTITNTAKPAHLSLDKDARANGTGTSLGDNAWTLAYDGPATSSGAGGVARTEVPIGSYTLTESGPTAGWTAGAWSCGDHPVTTDPDGTGHVNIALGEDVSCQVVNTAQPSYLTLDKDARANGSGTTLGDNDWTLAFDGPVTASGAGGVASTEVPIGSYTLTETGPTAGWTAGAWTCGDHPVTTDADGVGHLDIALGEDVSCSIVNTAMRPGLTLLKKVDGHGTGAETYTPDTSWTLHADLVGNESPAVAISGTEGEPEVTGAGVPVGTYALSESGGPAPWTTVGWACTDAKGNPVPVTGDTVAIALGQAVACEVTNRAVPSTWTVTKTNTPGSGTTVNEGDVITYTVTATKNAGGVDVLGAKVTDDLSDILPTKGTLVGSIVTSSGTADPVGTSIVWTIPRLGAVPQTMTYQVRVGSLDGVTLRNHATGDGAEECLKGNPDCTTTNPTPHYVLHKSVDFDDSDGDGYAEPGQDLVYTLHLRNDSQAELTDVVVHDDISDVLEHGTLDTAALAAQGLALDDTDPAHPFLVWKVAGPVLPGDTAEATYTVTVADGAWGESLVNVATPEDGVGSCTAAADCTTTTDTPPETVLTLRKDVDPGTTGDDTAAAAWHLSATPTPAIADQGVVDGDGSVTETVRIGTYLLAETGPSTYEADEAGWVCTDDAGDAVAVTAGKVTTPRGAHVTCAITNHAIPSGWRVTKTSPTNLGTVRPGDTIEYQLTVQRVGSGVDVRDIDVTDHLVDVLTGGKATFDTGSALSSTAGTVTEPTAGSTDLVWHLDRLHDTATLDYSVTVGDVFGAVLRNAATPGSEPCVDLDPTDAVECDSTTHYTPHYTLDKAVDFDDPDGDGMANPGQDLTYTLTVRNDTEHAVVDGVVVLDDLSDVLLDAAMTSTSDELAAQGLALKGPEGNEHLEWTVPGPVAPGASVSASYVVTIDGHAWGRSLRNVATPQDDEGDCGQCTTTTETPQTTTLVVKKVDMEDESQTPAGLPGAEFELYRDLGTVGSLDDADVLVPPLDDPDGDGDTVTGADGLARWGELRPGAYLVVEVSAPPGYDLPDNDTMPVVITDPGTFVPGGEMATILFRDIAQGQLTVTKQQWEKSGDAWVASDGVVAHGDLVKYTLHVETQGLKRFHDVTVRDYVPNHNPDDTTSTGTASLVADSAVCVQVVCTVDVADDLITWHLGTLEEGAVDVEFVVRFPTLPAHPTYDENDEFRTLLWNQGYVDWQQVSGHGEGGLQFQPGTAASNEVRLQAVVTQPEEPVEPPIIPEEPVSPPSSPPSSPLAPVLPGTGAPEHLLQLAFLGTVAVAAGIALVGRRRRRGEVG